MENNLHEIESLLTESNPHYEDCYGWQFWLHEGGGGEFVMISDELMARTVHTVGGHEGGGEKVVVVVEVSPHVGGIQKFSMESQFFKKLGFYGSYYGCEFDGKFSEVKPQKKTITVYEEG